MFRILSAGFTGFCKLKRMALALMLAVILSASMATLAQAATTAFSFSFTAGDGSTGSGIFNVSGVDSAHTITGTGFTAGIR